MENVKDTKEAKTRVVLINQIIDRAAELGIMYSSRLSHSMDINYAVQVFDIDLKAWLDSTNNDFIHDYVGIYKNIDRDAIFFNTLPPSIFSMLSPFSQIVKIG